MATSHDNDGLIHEPAFITLEMLNGTRIQGRHVAYSDPVNASGFGAFVMKDEAGSTSYVPWPAILRLNVWPLAAGTQAPNAESLPAPTDTP